VLTDVVERGGGLRDLFESRTTFVDQRVAALYGAPYNGSGDFVPLLLPPDQRAGMLTDAAFVVSRSRGEPIVHRGKWIREELLCGDIPEPPANINTDPPPGEDLTSRQFSERRIASSTCGACHQLMDGIGLTFAHYDPLGRFTDKDERGGPADASGDIVGSDFDGPVADALELVHKLAGSAQVRACIETRMLSYALGREVASDEPQCEQRRIDAAILPGGARVLDLVAAIAESPAFLTRQGGL
jgi:hypothetical protein